MQGAPAACSTRRHRPHLLVKGFLPDVVPEHASTNNTSRLWYCSCDLHGCRRTHGVLGRLAAGQVFCHLVTPNICLSIVNPPLLWRRRFPETRLATFNLHPHPSCQAPGHLVRDSLYIFGVLQCLSSVSVMLESSASTASSMQRGAQTQSVSCAPNLLPEGRYRQKHAGVKPRHSFARRSPGSVWKNLSCCFPARKRVILDAGESPTILALVMAPDHKACDPRDVQLEALPDSLSRHCCITVQL